MAEYTDLINTLREFWNDGTESIRNEAADAIEELSKNLERSKEWETFWEKEANEALKKFHTTVASMPRWIPVTERLPEEAGYYITAFSKGEVGQNMYMTFADGSGKWYQNSEDTGEVTHWMPLPAPPKEKHEYISREEAKAKIREKFKKLADRIEINEVPNFIPAADVAPRCPHYIRNIHNRGDDGLCEKWGCEVKEVQPVRHGRWERYSQGQPFPLLGSRSTYYAVCCDWFRCSECGVGFEAKTSYCPNCGAKMEASE